MRKNKQLFFTSNFWHSVAHILRTDNSNVTGLSSTACQYQQASSLISNNALNNKHHATVSHIYRVQCSVIFWLHLEVFPFVLKICNREYCVTLVIYLFIYYIYIYIYMCVRINL